MPGAVILAAVGVLILVAGRLSAAGRLPRNGFVGIRIPSTMRSDRAWLAGHRAGAFALTMAGGGSAVIAIASAMVSSNPSAPLISVAWLVAWTVVAAIKANRAARDAEDR